MNVYKFFMVLVCTNVLYSTESTTDAPPNSPTPHITLNCRLKVEIGPAALALLADKLRSLPRFTSTEPQNITPANISTPSGTNCVWLQIPIQISPMRMSPTILNQIQELREYFSSRYSTNTPALQGLAATIARFNKPSLRGIVTRFSNPRINAKRSDFGFPEPASFLEKCLARFPDLLDGHILFLPNRDELFDEVPDQHLRIYCREVMMQLVRYSSVHPPELIVQPIYSSMSMGLKRRIIDRRPRISFIIGEQNFSILAKVEPVLERINMHSQVNDLIRIRYNENGKIRLEYANLGYLPIADNVPQFWIEPLVHFGIRSKLNETSIFTPRSMKKIDKDKWELLEDDLSLGHEPESDYKLRVKMFPPNLFMVTANGHPKRDKVVGAGGRTFYSVPEDPVSQISIFIELKQPMVEQTYGSLGFFNCLMTNRIGLLANRVELLIAPWHENVFYTKTEADTLNELLHPDPRDYENYATRTTASILEKRFYFFQLPLDEGFRKIYETINSILPHLFTDTVSRNVANIGQNYFPLIGADRFELRKPDMYLFYMKHTDKEIPGQAALQQVVNIIPTYFSEILDIQFSGTYPNLETLITNANALVYCGWRHPVKIRFADQIRPTGIIITMLYLEGLRIRDLFESGSWFLWGLVNAWNEERKNIAFLGEDEAKVKTNRNEIGIDYAEAFYRRQDARIKNALQTHIPGIQLDWTATPDY